MRHARVRLTNVEDGPRKLDMTKMAGTVVGLLPARRANAAAVDGAQFGVVQATLARPLSLLVHRLWVLDVADGHILDLFGGEEAELDLLDRLERRLRVGEVEVGHGCGGVCR